jgi:ABC-type lipoprotein export system ATPase subunit
VLENVLVPLIPAGSADEAARRRAMDLLDRVGLADRADSPPSELSGGQRQRVAVVRALINSPKLVLADEPTGSLDGESAEALANLLTDLNAEEGAALVVVTHSEPLAGHMRRRLYLRDGKLDEQAPPGPAGDEGAG